MELYEQMHVIGGPADRAWGGIKAYALRANDPMNLRLQVRSSRVAFARSQKTAWT